MKIRSIVIFSVIFTITVCLPLFAQDEPKEEPKLGWKNAVVGNFNITQTSFDNWTQGGENSSAWQVNINGEARNIAEKYKWDNSGKISYGSTKIADIESRKSIDEIKAESVFTYILGTYVNPYVAATGETQFTAGYIYEEDSKTEISNILDPGYFTQSAGLGYEPASGFKTRLGFAVKETITRNFPAPYADDPDTVDIEKTKIEPGMESVTDYTKALMGNILLTSKLELFSNFKGIKEVDVKWDNIFSAKISKYISVSFNVKLFYDRDVSEKRQLKQSLALGLTYTFL